MNQINNIAEGLRPLATSIAKLRLDPKNARVHPGRNLESIKESLKAFGQRRPVVVNSLTGVVEAGNGVVTAALDLGWTEVAALFVDDDPATATGYALADNRTQETSFFDREVLVDLIRDLEATEADLVIGWTPSELDEIMGRMLQPDPPAAPGAGGGDGDEDQEEGGGGAGLGGGKAEGTVKTLTVHIPAENYETFINDVETVARGLGLDDSSEAIIRGMSILAVKEQTK